MANFDGLFGTNLSATHDGIKEAIAEKGKEFDEADPMKKAEMSAEMTGYSVVIIADAIWGSKSVSKFSKAAKASKLGRVAQTSKFGQMFSKIATKASELADILKQAAKNKAKNVYDKLKDVVKGIFRVKKRKLKWDQNIAKDVEYYNKLADEYIDCSDIASQLNRKFPEGQIMELTPKSGQTIKGLEYGVETDFVYHQVYIKNGYVYDPMLGDVPVKTKDFIDTYKKMNPEGFEITYP